MNSCDYDKTKHRYYINEDAVPSVTQVLADNRLIPDYSNDDNPRVIGSLVHHMLEVYDKGKDISLYKGSEAFLNGWQLFMKESEAHWLKIEVPMYSNLLKFAGTSDRIGYCFKKYYVIDIKTGSQADYHKIQTAGYKILESESLGENINSVPIHRACVYLPGNGSYKFVEHTSRMDERIFIAALTLTHYRGDYDRSNGRHPKNNRVHSGNGQPSND